MKIKSGLIKGISFITKLFEWLIFIVLIITTLIVLSPILPTKRFISTYVVATSSMEKTISAGSIAFVQPVKSENIQKGDIVTFTSPKNTKLTVIHRIYDVKEDNHLRYFLTKGDNNNAPDNWKVPEKNVKGKYLFSIPVIGQIGTYARTLKGFTVIIIIPAIIIGLLQIRTIKQGINEEIERRTKVAIEKIQKDNKNSSLKNIILFIFIINGFLVCSNNSFVQALFVSSAKVSGISFSVADFKSHPKPPDHDKLKCDKDREHEDDHDNKNKHHIFYTISKDKKTAILNFSHLKSFKKFSYDFEYESHGIKKGIIGFDIKFDDKDEYSKIVDLATCSDNDNCRYDNDLKNFKLKARFTNFDDSETDFED